jgi:hypothetical protein
MKLRASNAPRVLVATKTASWFMRSEWQKFNAGAGIGKRLLHLCVRSRTSGERAKGQNHHYGLQLRGTSKDILKLEYSGSGRKQE